MPKSYIWSFDILDFVEINPPPQAFFLSNSSPLVDKILFPLPYHHIHLLTVPPFSLSFSETKSWLELDISHLSLFLSLYLISLVQLHLSHKWLLRTTSVHVGLWKWLGLCLVLITRGFSGCCSGSSPMKTMRESLGSSSTRHRIFHTHPI